MAILGCVLVALTTFMTGIADTYFGLLLWRGLTGVGSAMYGVSSMALLFAAAPPHMRGRASSLSGGGFVLGGMAGPALGGLIADISMQAPFFFYAVTMLLGGMVVMILLPRTPTQQREQMRDQTLGLTDLIKDSRFRAAMVVNFATHWQSFGVRSLLVPLFVVESLTMTTTWVGIAFTLAAITQALTLHLVGTGTDRLGRRFMLIAGGITTASASIGLALTGSYVGLVLLMCIYSVGASATLSASQAMLADIVPVSASSGIAAYQMSGDIGLILGPMIAGFVLDALSLSWAWVLGALIISMGVVMCWFTPKNPSSISNTD
jgi:MFS family permease